MLPSLVVRGARIAKIEQTHGLGRHRAKRSLIITSESAKLDRVRPFVRPSVRIIIDFYQEDMKGAETLLYLGSLNYGF